MHSAASLPGIMSQRRGFSERMRELITEPISDAGLLERFASQRDEAAFGELVKRHGPQVLKVCHRGLPNEHDVEDVFQATFFVLAHKAAAVSWNESVESWLCAVARRLVLHARANAWQRQSRERPITALGGARAAEYGGFLPDQYHPHYDPHEEMERRDIRRVLHAALGQLPEKLAGRPGSAIGLPCWVRLDNWTPPASAATKSSGTRSSHGAVPRPEKRREIGSLPASAEFHKLQLFQGVWATIRASASGSRLLLRIE